ncbi:MAG: response regulator, partial [Mariprofundaceae bacterium]|nr:response regulator [Mariprofundaceae bacterium]
LLNKVGVTVNIANNGKESIEMITEKDYDAVLMDLQMPVMGGIEATQVIRRIPEYADLPIIAMTANAMQGDAKKCIEAGMNAHLAKPIEPEVMYRELCRWIQPSIDIDVDLLSTEKTVDPVLQEFRLIDGRCLDVTLGLRRVAQDAVLYRKILNKFYHSQADIVARIAQSHQSGDNETACREAHTLKGVAGNIGAQPLAEAAEKLEKYISANNSDVAGFLDLLKHVESKHAIVQKTLATFCETPKHSACETNNLDIAVVYPLIQQMNALLLEDDGEAVDILDELTVLLPAGLVDEAMRKLKTSLDQYDFHAAMTHLNAIADMCLLEQEKNGGLEL